MPRPRWSAPVLALTGVLAVVGLTGVAGAQDATPDSPTALLAALGDLEPQLPAAVPPQGVALEDDETWGELVVDATAARNQLSDVEPELRELFVTADDADGDVAENVAHVARGWLDVWTGTTSIAAAENHDIEFPRNTSNAEGVATGADELHAQIEVGIELLLSAHERLLAGYTALRALDDAEPDVQARIVERATSAIDYDRQRLPRLLVMLSEPSATVLVPTDRFVTDAPGIVRRASSLSAVCVDREALNELGGVATPEVLAEIGTVDRAGCPAPLPALAD